MSQEPVVYDVSDGYQAQLPLHDANQQEAVAILAGDGFDADMHAELDDGEYESLQLTQDVVAYVSDEHVLVEVYGNDEIPGEWELDGMRRSVNGEDIAFSFADYFDAEVDSPFNETSADPDAQAWSHNDYQDASSGVAGGSFGKSRDFNKY